MITAFIKKNFDDFKYFDELFELIKAYLQTLVNIISNKTYETFFFL